MALRMTGFAKGLLALPLIFLTGCIGTTEPTMSFTPPKYVEELPSKEEEIDFGKLGSLYGQGEKPLFSDRKAMRVNDIVTVVISENASASSSSDKELDKTNNMTLTGPAFTYNGPTTGTDTVEGLMNNLNKYTSIGATLNNTRAFEGSGTNTRTESFTTTISARIIKVLNNNNYYIEGGREILVDGEKQIIRVAGVIRPDDIDQTNQISSTLIADARIFYETQGDLKQATEKAWGTKVLDTVWPF